MLGFAATATAHHRSSAGRVDAFAAGASQSTADADARTLAVTLGSSYGHYDRWRDPSGTSASPGTLGRLVGDVGLRFDAGRQLGLWLRLPVGMVRIAEQDGADRSTTGLGDLQLGARVGVHRRFALQLGASLPTGSRSAGQFLQQTQMLDATDAAEAGDASGSSERVLFRSQTDASLGAGAPGLWLGASGQQPLASGVQAHLDAGWRGFLGAAQDGWAWGQDWTARAALSWQSAGGGLGVDLGLGALLHQADQAPGRERYGARRELAVHVGVDVTGPGRSRCALATRVPVGQWSEDALLLASVEVALQCRVVVAGG